MAKKNRTELLATVNALTPIARLETHDKPQRNELIESAMLLKDRVSTVNPANPGAVQLDFTNFDLIKSTYSGFPAAFSITGLTEGDIKFWWLSKGNSGYTTGGVESLVIDQGYLNETPGEYLFMIVHKGGALPYLIPLNFTGDFLSKALNGSDIADIEAFRNNISVYSKAQVDSLLAKTPWTNCTRVASQVEAASFFCRVRKQLGVVVGSGNIKLTSKTTGVLFTLPANVKPPTVDWYFSACDAGRTESENIEMYIKANTREVYAFDISKDGLSSFNFSYIED